MDAETSCRPRIRRWDLRGVDTSYATAASRAMACTLLSRQSRNVLFLGAGRKLAARAGPGGRRGASARLSAVPKSSRRAKICRPWSGPPVLPCRRSRRQKPPTRPKPSAGMTAGVASKTACSTGLVAAMPRYGKSGLIAGTRQREGKRPTPPSPTSRIMSGALSFEISRWTPVPATDAGIPARAPKFRRQVQPANPNLDAPSHDSAWTRTLVRPSWRQEAYLYLSLSAFSLTHAAARAFWLASVASGCSPARMKPWAAPS